VPFRGFTIQWLVFWRGCASTVEAQPQPKKKICARARKGKAFPQGRAAEPRLLIEQNVETPAKGQAFPQGRAAEPWEFNLSMLAY